MFIIYIQRSRYFSLYNIIVNHTARTKKSNIFDNSNWGMIYQINIIYQGNICIFINIFTRQNTTANIYRLNCPYSFTIFLISFEYVFRIFFKLLLFFQQLLFITYFFVIIRYISYDLIIELIICLLNWFICSNVF